MHEKLPKFAFFISIGLFLVLGGFGFGLAVSKFHIWPYRLLTDMTQMVLSFYETGTVLPAGELVPARATASHGRISIRSSEAMVPGFRAIMGYDHEAGHFAIWLIDETGQTQHVWPIRYQEIDPDGPSNGSDQPHGMKILQDGSVLINFDRGDAMTRLDGCGKPIWIKNGFFHHSIDRAEDGSYWTWEAEDHPHGHYQYLVNFDSETGKTIRKLSLIDDIIRQSHLNALEFSIPQGFKFRIFDTDPKEFGQDIFHPNDIEELTSDLAEHFPLFSSGDLLISLRSLHLVAILDPDKKIVKWASRRPWRYQHDPDFAQDGTISVYDNNQGRGQSKIVAINPSSGEVKTKFDQGNLKFYSGWMGKHQLLPNDGALIVSPSEGRVLEVDSIGNVIFEFNNVATEQHNGHVENAMWVPKDYFRISPTCQ